MTLVTPEAPAASSNQSRTLRILVGDDQADVLEALRLLLKGAGHQSVLVDSPQALLRAARSDRFDLILMDLNYARDTTSGAEGLDLLSSLQAQSNAAPIVVMTAWGSVDLAVQAMRRGACDFVQKPWDNTRLLETVRKQAAEAAERIEARRRVQSEMEIARNVQEKLFPHATRSLARLDFAGRCLAAREVSGDYYDFLDTGDGGLAFLLADVSGKGVAAALLMANLQASFRSQASESLRYPAEALRVVNKLFCESTPPEHFATLFFGYYDQGARRLNYANCGHLPPVLMREDGSIERLAPTATVIGVFKDWTVEQRSIELRPGDTVLLFSDGVTEAGIEKGREFGEEGLLSLLAGSHGQSAQALADQIVNAVAGERHDDVTAVVLRAR